ncbi:hypothetical protein LIER_25606 [Lithospermum erythrorhizon]|uniref:Uncharacterized protein n=1 Tax=Lithospermum erythrorhizon TaxID=34254 RepID=A0AAV3R9Q1_LITER
MSTEGVQFCSEENEARWNFICAWNILPERYLSEATVKNQTYMDILEESGMLAIAGDIGPHWPSIVREFICSLSEDITDPSSPMFHKVKLKRQVFEFSPIRINMHYERGNEGITGSTVKLSDIIKTLIGNALSAWPTKGQLQASSLSLRVAELQAKIQALKTTLPPVVNDSVPTDDVEPDAIPLTVNDPASNAVGDPDETSPSHV